MTLLVSKLLFGVATFAAAFFGGWLPLRQAQTSVDPRSLQRGNALAAGILLGIGIVHLLPEADTAWRAIMPDYPAAFVLAAVAFLAILFVEHVLLPPHHHKAHEGIGHGRTELPDEFGAHVQTQYLYAYALLIALSIHSFVSGAALGMQHEAAKAFTIFVAIIAHKTTEGFALGVSMTRNNVHAPVALVFLILFASTTLVGIIAGVLVTDLFEAGAARGLEAGFLAFAAGTFIYIASLDIITEEFTHGGDRWTKWCLALFGLALTALLALWL
jgi:zinc transporter 1/2/3